MESILVDFRGSKIAFFNKFEGFEFLFFRKITLLKMSKVPNDLKFRAAQRVKMAVFGAPK